MPRPGPRKPQLSFRYAEDRKQVLQDAAEAAGRDVTAEVTARMEWSDATMPDGWAPGDKIPARLRKRVSA